jgi:hypothetical protein
MTMYSQHDWGNLTWALMLTCLVALFFLAMVVFLVVAGSEKATHSEPLPPHHPDAG